MIAQFIWCLLLPLLSAAMWGKQKFLYFGNLKKKLNLRKIIKIENFTRENYCLLHAVASN